MNEDNTLSTLLAMIQSGKLTELESERLLNAAARYKTGIPTGGPLGRPEEKHPED